MSCKKENFIQKINLSDKNAYDVVTLKHFQTPDQQPKVVTSS